MAQATEIQINLTVNLPVIATKEELVEAFAEWDREYREDPEAFESTLACIAKGKTSEDYGHGATRTLEAYLAKVRLRRDEQFAARYEDIHWYPGSER